MKRLIQIISILFSIVLIILACLVLPAAEGLVKALAIIGIITAILCIIAVIAWIIVDNAYGYEANQNRLWRMKTL